MACLITDDTVPEVPEGEDGNSGTSSPLYRYDFVINNYTPEEYKKLCASVPTIAKKWIIAKEVGEENGVPHLQCYISLKLKMRITKLRRFPGLERASMRACRNEEALIEYCKKDGDYISGGFPKPVKIIANLYKWQKEIEDIYLEEPNDRKIYWFWEPTGNIGKSAFVKYMVVKYSCLFCDGGKKSDLINLAFNNDMDKCKAIIWDLPRATQGHISYGAIESFKNGLICNTKYETGVKAFNSPHVFIFANYEPEFMDRLSEDRWVIKKL